ncbi:MAG: 30S ribosomal protein S3 [bacterium]|nr:30S ribosomal protein S3 [bacterium]MCX7917416.1 30S ribosomal protein S3 [bacterium]MDW8164321.1 30S ribosomal protein S3 [Candidatus Omnitrophota bacterium]
MGQKVNPIGLRIGIVEDWRSKWFASKKEFKELLKEDIMIRDYIKKRYPRGTITKIEIEKTDKIRIRIYTPRPGVVLGRKGAEINQLRDELYEIFKKQITIDCIEINQPGTSAQFLADSIVIQLEKRVPHRQAIKKAMDLAMQSGAKGIKVRISGRIAGVEIARSEQYIVGKVPLHTLRAKIDYATSTAFTRSGTVGVKVWVYLGEILEEKGEENAVNA